MMINRPTLFVVIPSLDRHKMLDRVINNLGLPQSQVIVIDTGSNPPLDRHLQNRAIVLSRTRDSERNIQKWWNAGLDYIKSSAEFKKIDKYHVAILNSDLIIERSDLDLLQDALTVSGTVVSHQDHSNELELGEFRVKHRRGDTPFRYKLTGYCFVVDGSLDLRFDERFRWWYGEDDFEWRAREMGGVVRVGGPTITNLDQDGAIKNDHSLRQQVFADREEFISKWGTVPSSS